MAETSAESVKVYELAKELGVDSLSLVDKLRDLQIVVKNHMSELSQTQVQRAREALSAKKKAAASPAAKAPTKRAAPVKRKKTSDEESAGDTAPASGATAASKTAAAASPIIRRRGAEAPTPAPVQSAPIILKRSATPTPAPTPVVEEPQFVQTDAVEPQMESAELTQSTSEVEQAESAPVVAEQTASPIVQKEAAPTQAPPPEIIRVRSRIEAPRPTLNFAAPTQYLNKLKVVEAAKPQPKKPEPARAGAIPGTSAPDPNSTADRGHRGIIKMTKENLDRMAEEEAARARGLKEKEIKPEDVRFADYKKREVVFMPKKKKPPTSREQRKTQITVAAAHKRMVEFNSSITVGDLANQMNLKSGEVIKKLMAMGQMATVNQALDLDTATLIATEYKFELKNASFNETNVLGENVEVESAKVARPPIVTVMGHVDHGKTSLLDSIREANVAAKEAGGITQHIGAYTVNWKGHKISFIDTPGHEAFSLMRARGANVTDIVVLVVAADDGVMPQTREAVSHAKAAGVPIVVAVNKIDKPGANPEKIKQGLAEIDLLAEEWGGQTMFVPVSAIKKTNIDKLLEAILLNAEVLELKADPTIRAVGAVLEARLEKGRGPVVSVLVQKGTLKVGDFILAGQHYGKVKAMVDDKGNRIDALTPGLAAEVLGFNGIPTSGDRFDVAATDTVAAKIVENRINESKAKSASTSRMSLDQLFAKIEAGNVKELRVIVKTDVYGSLEAVRDSLIKLSTEKVKVNVIHAATGGISESDILLASASSAIVIGFNIRPETKARQLSEQEHVEVKTYTIIYELLEDIKKAMAGLLDKKKVEKFLGRAEVRQTFSIPKIGMIAGTSVIDGKISRNARIRLLRDSRVIFDGKLSSLKRFKDDAREVAQGYECGIGLENFNDLKLGDIIEAYEIELISQELS